ncbi:LysE family translocator [Pelodictyon luteolum]|uniref:Amino acid efflux protein, putative n=1 Tax=Chlorobium luteolum (strain DSM 273 / BCRC 81028 / 2530) TaxID=319225 RepID=Q3B4F5_CHLL3|nr:LysE family translocator [Pelodictyon luteolum]ABB23776.1 amino acid efflux protein, putative [Pelodictyon luteolum DSM 273]
MIHTTLLPVFISASVLLALSPGPDNLFVVTQSARRGWRSGFILTLGLCTGLVFHTLSVAFGLAALIRGSLPVFTLLKAAGALYLLFLAYRALTSKCGPDDAGGASPAIPPVRLYRRGIVMNITNPKVSLFFLAFLPQFADPESGPLVPQFLLLGLIFIAATLPVFTLLSLIAGHAGGRLRRSERAQRITGRLSALLYIGLALRLALGER